MKRIYRSFLQRFFKKSIDTLTVNYDCYSSIDDLPAWNFFKCSDTGNLGYLLFEFQDVTDNYLYDLWLDIQDELHEVFGRHERYKDYIKLLKKVIEKRADTIIFDDRQRRRANMELRIAEAALKAFMSQGVESSLDQTVVAVEKFMKREIDLKSISIRKFMSYQQSIKNNGKD